MSTALLALGTTVVQQGYDGTTVFLLCGLAALAAWIYLRRREAAGSGGGASVLNTILPASPRSEPTGLNGEDLELFKELAKAVKEERQSHLKNVVKRILPDPEEKP